MTAISITKSKLSSLQYQVSSSNTVPGDAKRKGSVSNKNPQIYSVNNNSERERTDK